MYVMLSNNFIFFFFFINIRLLFLRTLLPWDSDGDNWWDWTNWFVPKIRYWVYSWTSTYSRVEWRIGMHSNYREQTYHDLPMCPKCKDFKACPFINITNYCLEAKFKNFLDNPFGLYSCGFIFIWGE